MMFAADGGHLHCLEYLIRAHEADVLGPAHVRLKRRVFGEALFENCFVLAQCGFALGIHADNIGAAGCDDRLLSAALKKWQAHAQPYRREIAECGITPTIGDFPRPVGSRVGLRKGDVGFCQRSLRLESKADSQLPTT